MGVSSTPSGATIRLRQNHPINVNVDYILITPLGLLRERRSALLIEMKVSAYQQADWLLAQREIPREAHVLLRENLASCLAQGPGDRWSKKIERDLDRPYSDREVFAHLQRLESLCLQLAPFSKGTWHVFGSIPKGRFGANSDVDVNCEGGLTLESVEALKTMPGWQVTVFHPNSQSDPRQLNAAVDSAGLEVTASYLHGELLRERLSRFDGQVATRPEPGFLTEMYTQALQRKGYRVECEPFRVVPPSQPAEPAAEMTWNLTGMPTAPEPPKENGGCDKSLGVIIRAGSSLGSPKSRRS